MIEDISISVIIPCFNSENTIQDCVNSVLNQSVNVNEIIIIDDGSTDNTRTLIKEILKEIPPKIKAISIEQQNQGPSAARNNGVKISSSAYIAFLDSDDKWFPENIRLIKEFITADNCYDIVSTRYQSAPTAFTGEVTFKKLLFKNYFLTPCVVVKRKTFQVQNGFDEGMRFSEDYFLWLNIMHRGKGYLLPYTGACNIEDKKPFGQKGLSSNLKEMHLGVLKAFQQLSQSRKISYRKYLMIAFFENIKYLRRLLISN
jgi:glycosyltransferase involved in cell wall biosynthesis